MPAYFIILIVLLIIVILSLLLSIFTSPIVWFIIIVLVIYSAVKRYLYTKKIDEFNKEFQRKAEEKKQTYYSQEAYRQGSDDVIDVDYKEYDD